jgi:hypothetical protein
MPENRIEQTMARPKGSGPTSTSFKPGETGNPGGRPKVVKEVRQLAQQYTVEAIQTLANIMQDPSEHASARVHAADIILNRGHGKAPQTFEATNLDVLTDAELDRTISDAIARLRAIGAERAALQVAGGKGIKVRKPH